MLEDPCNVKNSRRRFHSPVTFRDIQETLTGRNDDGLSMQLSLQSDKTSSYLRHDSSVSFRATMYDKNSDVINYLARRHVARLLFLSGKYSHARTARMGWSGINATALFLRAHISPSIFS